MDSLEISIKVQGEQQEILISELSELGALGFEQLDDTLLAYFAEANFNSYEVNVLLSGFTFQIQSFPERNWNDEWERNFSPVIIEQFCAIRADFHAPIEGVEHEIVITPKMSFGTGHHATTVLMIEQMKEMDLREKDVFDFGTGTGILAILAEKLGARKITAIDADHWSRENATENIARNGCLRISVDLTSQVPHSQFDIVLANINRHVILEYLPQIKSVIKTGGYLLLSGLLMSDHRDIVEATADRQWRLIKQTDRNNWISLVFYKAWPDSGLF